MILLIISAFNSVTVSSIRLDGFELMQQEKQFHMNQLYE